MLTNHHPAAQTVPQTRPCVHHNTKRKERQFLSKLPFFSGGDGGIRPPLRRRPGRCSGLPRQRSGASYTETKPTCFASIAISTCPSRKCLTNMYSRFTYTRKEIYQKTSSWRQTSLEQNAGINLLFFRRRYCVFHRITAGVMLFSLFYLKGHNLIQNLF